MDRNLLPLNDPVRSSPDDWSTGISSLLSLTVQTIYRPFTCRNRGPSRTVLLCTVDGKGVKDMLPSSNLEEAASGFFHLDSTWEVRIY